MPGCLAPAGPRSGSPQVDADSGVPPCIFPILKGVAPGMKITITGKILENPEKFTISLQHGRSIIPSPEIALRINIRFTNSSIAVNSRYNGAWGEEESSLPVFPFKPEEAFSILISVRSTRYSVLINNQHTISFQHRLRALFRINTLYIENDAVIFSIRCVEDE